MSIEFRDVDIFSLDVQALVNPVNCVGVMGKGLALQFKKRFPSYYQDYKHLCDQQGMLLGKVQAYRLDSGNFIIDFPTKYHWRDTSLLSSIEIGLMSLTDVLKENGIMSVGIPKLGCGLGGLSWDEVRPLIEKHLSPLSEIAVIVV